ncbi:MAG: family 43 glycosylhydrolase, partial [Bacteroidales bacterium]|nr:family 43 glycosylhydrolase [Bacteroidales bacterium]
MKRTLIIFGLLVAAVLNTTAANPYLPLWEHIPDGEPYVFEDPDNPGKYRVYIYGSHDIYRTKYCGPDQVVWSTPVEDLNNWRYDGVIFESKTDAKGNLLNQGGEADVLFAPDIAVVTESDGTKTYYLYPNTQNGGRQTMVAKSKRPDGPFQVCNWNPEKPNETIGILHFDPAAFVDDDGRAYAYWGFGESWGAELDTKTMATLKTGGQRIENLIPGYKQDDTFRFFEASSMRKIKDKYVLIYSRWTRDGEFGLPGTNYTLAYAYGNHPLGPFTYGGTIIDGRAREKDANGN